MQRVVVVVVVVIVSFFLSFCSIVLFSIALLSESHVLGCRGFSGVKVDRETHPVDIPRFHALVLFFSNARGFFSAMSTPRSG